MSQQPSNARKSSRSNTSDKLALDKLKESGLTLQDAKLLGFQFLDGQKTQNLHSAYKPFRSIRINYYDINGDKIRDGSESKRKGYFYRLRYLESPSGFDAITTKKPQRYVQPPGTLPHAYFPRSADWQSLVENADAPLIITEGEFKAAKACKEGFPTIGLGGVYSWRSMKIGITFLPSLEQFNWERRNIYICFDSDYKTNPMVCAALRDLAEELHRRGGYVHIVTLPQIAGSDKVGLDDYIVESGPSSLDTFRELLTNAEPLGLTSALWDLNDKYAYIRDPGLVIDMKTKFKASPNAFRDHLESSSLYQERQLLKDGTVSFKPVNASTAWLRWPLRNQVQKITYSPGEGQYLQRPNGVQLNIWPGWGAEPEKGDVRPFIDLLTHIFRGEKDALKWFLRWCAFPLQNPGVKMFTSVVIHGVRHGTGKSFIGYTLAKIYGKNFTEISQMDLHGQFNEWAEGKQFVMGDDVTGSNKRADADFLKKMITQRELRVNGKYVPTYTVPDCINYFFTANHADAFFLEDDDRRFFIHEVQVGPLSEEFYVEYDLWLSTTGPSAVFHYLKNLDLGTFNPAAPALRTSAKERMIANVQSDLASWVRQLINNSDYVLKLGAVTIDKDLFTSKELLSLYDPSGHTGTTSNGLGREMSRAGIFQVCSGKPIRLSDGSQARYYAVRNSDKWVMANTKVVKDHLEKWLKDPVSKEGKKY